MKSSNSTEGSPEKSPADQPEDHASRERIKEIDKEAVDPTHEKNTDEVRERQNG
jgi:hypothetical protein